VFSTASVFDPDCAYTKFAAYTILNHAGNYIASATGLRKQGYGHDMPAGHGFAFPLTDCGNAERLMSLHGQDMRYSAERGKWRIWDGQRWAIDVDGEAMRRAKSTVRAIGHIRNDLAALVGARMVAASEVDEGRELSASVIKSVSGGDTLSVRLLYREFFETKPTYQIVLIANDAPKVSATDGAMWRRLLRIPMENTIAPDKRDPNIKLKLQTDTAVQQAVLAWIVEGCRGWQANGLSVPDLVTDATTQYRTEMNPLAEFVADKCVLKPGTEAFAQDAWDEYVGWCALEGGQPVARNKFAIYLGYYGVDMTRVGNGKRKYRNVCLAA
jgi:phage/plasmid-associated DNA primase